MTSAFEHREDPDWESVEGPVLIAGDVRDLPLIADICRRLPWDAQGAVLFEAAARIQIRHVDVPYGVSVRWLLRDGSDQARTKGERLAAAVHAWCIEWACAEPETQWTVWLGPHAPTRVAQMTRSLLGVHSPAEE